MQTPVDSYHGCLHFMRLSQAIQEFTVLRTAKGPRAGKTAARYAVTLRIFCLCMQDPEIEQLDLSHVLWFFAELERLGWKPNGLNLAGIAIKKLFEFCHLRGYAIAFSEQLIPLREKEFSIPRVAKLEDFKKLLAQIPVKTNQPHHLRNRALLMLLWDTGARSGELCLLNEHDLQFKKDSSGSALIKTEKSRGRRPVREIFWTATTGRALCEWIKKKNALQKQFSFADIEALFTTISKAPQMDVRGSRMSPRGVAEIMRVLSNQAGLPVLNAHSIRHSMGRDAIRALRSNSGVSNILGHANLDSSYVYTMLFGEELREQWEEVMQRRGKLIPKAPQLASNFPPMRSRSGAVVNGQFRPVKVKTSKRAIWERS